MNIYIIDAAYITAVTSACLFAICMTIFIVVAVILSIHLFKSNAKSLTALELAANSQVLQSDNVDKLQREESISTEENIAYGPVSWTVNN